MATETVTKITCDRCLRVIEPGEYDDNCSDISLTLDISARQGRNPDDVEVTKEVTLDDLCVPCGQAVRALWNKIVLKAAPKFESMEDRAERDLDDDEKLTPTGIQRKQKANGADATA